jgi:hypothetical protein
VRDGPVSPRTIAYLGIATGLLLVGALVEVRSRRASEPTEATPGVPTGATLEEAPPTTDGASRPLRSPPSAVAELGVLTDRADLEEAVDRQVLVKRVLADGLCGDERSCAAVAEALRDERTTHLQIALRSDWDIDRIDLDAAAAGLAGSARKSLPKRSRIVVVRVATATSTLAARGLATRAAFAAAAAIASRIDGLVYDQLLGRIESARDFAKHAPTEPQDASTFRPDRVQLLYQPRAEGVVRILTAGLSRWGAPDVEAAAVPTAASPRVAEIVLGVAEKVANGLTTGPARLTRADLASLRGAPYPTDAGLPDDREVGVDLTPTHPEAGDPNDFIARIVPTAGDGPMGYLDLAERFFGPALAASPGEDAIRARTSRAREALGPALGRWRAARAEGAKLLVLLPFPIPGDAGVESMWVDLTAYDDRTVTGRIVDEPLGATDVARGDSVTRPRSEVEDVDDRAARD